MNGSRYERHEKLIDISILRKKKVLVAGVGGLGTVCSEILVRLGVGEIHLIDPKVVDEPDLNRQILYDYGDLGKKKVEAAKEKLERIAPDVRIFPIDSRIDTEFSLPEVDGILDCLDNWKSRFILDELAHTRRIPFVHAGVRDYYGQVTTIIPGETQSLRELFIDAIDEKELSVHPSTVILIASIQSFEMVNLLFGKPKLAGKLFIYDLRYLSSEVIELER